MFKHSFSDNNYIWKQHNVYAIYVIKINNISI